MYASTPSYLRKASFWLAFFLLFAFIFTSFGAGTLTVEAEGTQTSASSEQDSKVSDPSQQDSETRDSTEQAAESSERSKESEALRGGKVIVGITQEPDFLDPQLAVAAGTKEILFNLFEGLVKMNVKGEFVPCLAKSWTSEKDGRALRFVLKEQVKFHNGETMTADDVVWSLRRAAGLDGGEAKIPQLAGLADVRAENDGKEVVVESKELNPDLLGFLNTAIMPRDVEKQNEHPIGTGPFEFVSYTPQVGLVMKRFEDYHGEKAFLDEVEFRIYGNMDAAYMELMSGGIDLFPYLTEEKAGSLKDLYEINEGGANMVQLMAMNNERAPLDDRRVREAVSLAVDRDKIVELVMGSAGTPLASGMSPEMGRFFNDELKPVKADPAAAKKLLKEAGYADGLTLTVTVPGNYLIHVDTANIIAAQLKEAGITLKIETVEWGTWLERVYAGRDYQMTIIALTYEYTPSDVLNRFSSTADNNFINFKNDAYDKLVAQAASENEDSQRVSFFHEMQKILADETASVFIQDPMNLTAVRKGLTGYHQYPAYVQDLSTVGYTDQALLDESLLR